MTLNDWTCTISHWLDAHVNAPGELERGQAALMLGSCLTVMARELTSDELSAVLTVNKLSASAAQVYMEDFAGHAEVREVEEVAI